MIRRFTVGNVHLTLAALLLVACLLMQQPAYASPFGQGVYSADVPFGADTSMSITLGGDVSLNLTSVGSNFVGSASNTVTVTSTDVIGYRLYVYSPNSATMVADSGSDTIPTSGNTSPGTLAVDTWGYNTDGSSNYLGMPTTPALIKDADGPHKTGDDTTVTYGALTDITKSAGNYTVGVVYTAVAKNP